MYLNRTGRRNTRTHTQNFACTDLGAIPDIDDVRSIVADIGINEELLQ